MQGLMDIAILLVSSVEWTLVNGLLRNSGVFVAQPAAHQEHTWLHQALFKQSPAQCQRKMFYCKCREEQMYRRKVKEEENQLTG